MVGVNLTMVSRYRHASGALVLLPVRPLAAGVATVGGGAPLGGEQAITGVAADHHPPRRLAQTQGGLQTVGGTDPRQPVSRAGNRGRVHVEPHEASP
jgi:hypothetical protein